MLTPVLYVQGGAERAGAEQMLYNLLLHLDRERFPPTVAFLADGPFVEQVEELGVEVIRIFGAGRLREVWTWGGTVAAIRGAMVTSAAQVLHANGEKMAFFATRAARSSRIPSIAWLHDAPGAGGPAGRAAQRLLRTVRPSATVTCSAWMALAFNRKLGLGAIPIINGLDPGALTPAGGLLDEIAREAAWPEDRVVVGHFARLQKWKGTEVFLRAASRLAAEIPQIHFVVVGGALYGREEEYARLLIGLADSLGLSTKVRFTGYVSDPLSIMASCDVVAHCSLKPDPFPTVVLEGMMLERAVVATRTGGAEEAIDDGRTGVLVKPGDVAALTEAIGTLARSSDQRARLGDAARKEALSRFGAKRMAQEFENLYERLIRESSSEGIGRKP